MGRSIVGILGSLFVSMALWCGIGVAATDEAAGPSRSDYMTLARTGWVYDIHSSRMRRDPDFPPVHFNSTEVALGAVCLFGDPPHALPLQIIEDFTALLHDVYGRSLNVRFAGANISDCPPRPRVFIRLYTGAPPMARFNADLRHMDREFDIRFPPNWSEPVTSPGQANGFFGRGGAVAHLLISQPPGGEMSALQRQYYTSLLIEELFQVVSFGADILKFDRETPFYSKLQEYPVNLRYLPWHSDRFMAGLLASNPHGLCGFDIFMLHALAGARLQTTNSLELLNFIETHFDGLRGRTAMTLADRRFASMLDARCSDIPD